MRGHTSFVYLQDHNPFVADLVLQVALINHIIREIVKFHEEEFRPIYGGVEIKILKT